MACSCESSILSHDTCDNVGYGFYVAYDFHGLHDDLRDVRLRELERGQLHLVAYGLVVGSSLGVPFLACDLEACVRLVAYDRLEACDLVVGNILEVPYRRVACTLEEPYLLEACILAFHLVACILVEPFLVVDKILVGIDLGEDILVLLVGSVRLASFLNKLYLLKNLYFSLNSTIFLFI